MTLLADVVAHCEQRNIKVALIGAAAMTVYGASRTTFDADLLTIDRSVLQPGFWSDFAATPDIRKGDFEDSLAGVVRIKRPDERTVDIVVGKYKFQAGVMSRAVRTNVAGATIDVVTAADLVLLKLFAGGLKDLLDVELLLHGNPDLRADIEQRIHELPDDARQLWQRFV